MSEGTIDDRVDDDRLFEFICAANGCLYDGGVFEKDERYQSAVAALNRLPGPTLLRYANILKDRMSTSQDKKKWERIYERFGYEFAEKIIPI